MPTLPSVLFLTHALGGGGAERATVNLANHLAEAGWKVGLLPLQTAGHRYLIHPRVEIDDAIPQGGNRYIRGLRKLSYIGRAVGEPFGRTSWSRLAQGLAISRRRRFARGFA